MTEGDQETGGTTPAEVSFGNELRREREVRGITLREISDSTKIGKRLLEAIEKDDFDILPAPVFTRGFIRQYAEYLGLNADEQLARYEHYVAATGQERDDPRPLISSEENLRRPSAGGIPRARIDRNLLILVAILVPLILLGFWVRSEFRSRRPVPAVPASSQTSAMEPAASQPVQPSEQPSGADDSLRMVVEATEDSWIDLKADGEPVYRGEMNAGQTREFTAKNELRFGTIGNAAGIRITLNGRTLEPLGKSGQVIRDRVYDRNSLDALRDSP